MERKNNVDEVPIISTQGKSTKVLQMYETKLFGRLITAHIVNIVHAFL
jgi:hypothetical protein